MIIGSGRSGKTSLANRINGVDAPPRRTPDIIYGKYTIDVPGAYLENPWMYKHLIAAAQSAAMVLCLVDQSECGEVYSPGFARAFRCPVAGVITKTDLKPEHYEKCVCQLKRTGVPEPYFPVDFISGSGVEALITYIKKMDREGVFA